MKGAIYIGRKELRDKEQKNVAKLEDYRNKKR